MPKSSFSHKDYDTYCDDSIKRQCDESPKPPELKQFDAYLRRELPRRIRKRLQELLESNFGLIEETIKNQLEGIVRDEQDELTRGYLSTSQSQGSLPAKAAACAQEENVGFDLDSTQAGPSNAQLRVQPEMDALSLYFVPPDTTGTPLPDTGLLAANSHTFAEPSDSAYYSLQTDDEWFETMINDSTSNFPVGHGDVEESILAGSWTGPVAEEVAPQESYTGKDKGKVNEDAYGNAPGDTRI